MIDLSGKDSFLIFQKPEKNQTFISIGQWSEISKFENLENETPVLNAFNQKTFKLEGEIVLLKEKVSITNAKNFTSPTTSKETHIQRIKHTVKACKNNKIKKCILSRIHIEPHQIIDFFPLFKELINSYRHGFKYILNHPEFGMWIGVSPETLISGSKNEGLFTHALAGSKISNSNDDWTLKEKEEHQYVSDYIRKIILNNGSLIRESETYDKHAGNVKHLNRDFHFNLSTPLFYFTNQLHPTPAIAGIPLKETTTHIQNIESHSREIYCGFIGTVNKNKCELFVNLRCGRITPHEFHLFVGGGITDKSIAEDEYIETEIKSQTLLSVIKKM